MEEQLLSERKKIILDILKSKEYVPMKTKELAMVLNVAKEDREELRYVLNELVNEGKIAVSKKGKYALASADIKVGTFEGNRRGFGFVSIEGEEEDIFIPEHCINGAINRDLVQVALSKDGKRGRSKEGEIVKILSHGTEEIVGIYQKSKNFGFVVPDDQKFNRDIFIPKEKSKGAMTGHKVVVKITDFGSKDKKPEGEVKEIIGHINDPGTDIMSIVKAYNIPAEFPQSVMDYLEKIPDEIDRKDMAGRLDLRDLRTVTIDGEDAKDLDDAVTLEKEGKFYHLGVHIADVSHYVKENSVLDKEALKRGTSVYLVDRVIPMLPQKLSNGICSLNQGCDRLALSCIMDIDEKGKVVGHRIAETVINVDRRMSYTNVYKILQRSDEEVLKEYEDYVEFFDLMKELAQILRDKRKKRGSIDFDFPESKIYLNEKGIPVDIKPYERNEATKIIEDFMLIANETVAEDYFWQEIPFVYRTHDNPDPEKMRKLELFINNFGYGLKMGKDEIHPKELQKLLQRIDGTPEEALISRITLRSMKQARYTTVSSGHFGLATQYYCHFTSPIRRYPDLQIHRIIKENLHGGISPKRIKHYVSILTEVAEQASLTERRADDAERDTDKLKKVQYMSKHIGERYEGVVSGITAYGMYVELPNTVEGMVHINSLKDDYYYYDEEKYELVGETTGRTYKLGESVTIEVLGTDKIKRVIDFELVEGEQEDGEGIQKTDSKQ
ncbi:MAG: ribonuclease R [Lachnospiraceae bacterium]|nr:ribonuclease R [Lachnospiraceae bacterium]